MNPSLATTPSVFAAAQHPLRPLASSELSPATLLSQLMNPRHVMRHVPQLQSLAASHNTLYASLPTSGPTACVAARASTSISCTTPSYFSRHKTLCLRCHTTPSTLLCAGEHTPATLLSQLLNSRHVPRHVPHLQSRHNTLCRRWHSLPQQHVGRAAGKTGFLESRWSARHHD